MLREKTAHKDLTRGEFSPYCCRQQPVLNCTTSEIDTSIVVAKTSPHPRSDVQPPHILPVPKSEGKSFSLFVHCTTCEFMQCPGQNALTLSLSVPYSCRRHEWLLAPPGIVVCHGSKPLQRSRNYGQSIGTTSFPRTIAPVRSAFLSSR